MEHDPHSPQHSEVFGDAFRLKDCLNMDTQFVEQLHDTTLRPYDDDDTLVGRLTTPSRVFRKFPEAVDVVSEALTTEDDGSLVAAAELLHEARQQISPPTETPVATLLSFLTMVEKVAIIKNDLVGVDAPNDRANAIATLAGRQLATGITPELLRAYTYSCSYLSNRLQQRIGSPNKAQLPLQFLEAKLEKIFSDLMGRLLANIFAEVTPDGDLAPVSPEKMTTDSAVVQKLFTELRTKQQYGIKLGYKKHELGGSIIFSPPLGEEKSSDPVAHPNIHPLMRDTPLVATVIRSNKRSFKTLKPEYLTMVSGTTGVNFDKQGAISVMHLADDGELYVDRACTISVRDIFAEAQKYGAYRKLHADVLASFFDMTQPAIVVDRINRALARAEVVSEQPATDAPMDVFHRLVVPRVRFAQQHPEFVASSMEEDAQEASHTKTLRYHGVTWHRRRLPDGWSPSPEAKELAEQAHIELKENETFVREHHRGAKHVGEVVAHQLFERARV